MPLYEYECEQCHRRIEKIQKFSDPELTVCPHCAGKLERTVTAPSFSVRGRRVVQGRLWLGQAGGDGGG